MQLKSPLLDDAAKLAWSLLTLGKGMTEEIRALLKRRVEKIFLPPHHVQREEFEALFEMTQKNRQAQEKIEETSKQGT